MVGTVRTHTFMFNLFLCRGFILCELKKRFFLDSYLMPFKTNNCIPFENFNILTCRLFLRFYADMEVEDEEGVQVH
jgi:hypothetical protein